MSRRLSIGPPKVQRAATAIGFYREVRYVARRLPAELQWCRAIEAATVTLSESMLAAIAIRTRRSAWASASAVKPLPSAPISNATRAMLRSTSSSGAASADGVNAMRSKLASRSRSSASGHGRLRRTAPAASPPSRYESPCDRADRCTRGRAPRDRRRMLPRSGRSRRCCPDCSRLRARRRDVPRRGEWRASVSRAGRSASARQPRWMLKPAISFMTRWLTTKTGGASVESGRAPDNASHAARVSSTEHALNRRCASSRSTTRRPSATNSPASIRRTRVGNVPIGRQTRIVEGADLDQALTPWLHRKSQQFAEPAQDHAQLATRGEEAALAHEHAIRRRVAAGELQVVAARNDRRR